MGCPWSGFFPVVRAGGVEKHGRLLSTKSSVLLMLVVVVAWVTFFSTTRESVSRAGIPVNVRWWAECGWRLKRVVFWWTWRKMALVVNLCCCRRWRWWHGGRNLTSVQMEQASERGWRLEKVALDDIGSRWRRWWVFIAEEDGVGGMAGEIWLALESNKRQKRERYEMWTERNSNRGKLAPESSALPLS